MQHFINTLFSRLKPWSGVGCYLGTVYNGACDYEVGSEAESRRGVGRVPRGKVGASFNGLCLRKKL